MSNQLLPRLRQSVKSVLMSAGMDFRMKTDDRRVLEDTILPAIARNSDYGTVLFIGCDWYTRGYQKLFAHRNYWTMEIDPSKKKFGARQHIVDSAENIAEHFKPASIDFIVCNGVIGWGLDDKPGIERMLEACWMCLRERGVLLIGWNDVPERTPVPISKLVALEKFQPYVLPVLGKSQLLTDSDLRHTYNFYIK
jgi:hypothetical protein